MLRDLPDPAHRHRRRMVLLPVVMLICFVLFCGYRARGVATMLIYGSHFLYEESYTPEKILASPDEAYSDKYFELVRSFPSDFEIRKRAQEIVRSQKDDAQDIGLWERENNEFNKIYKVKIKEQKKTLLRLANLLDTQYNSGQPMQINLLKYWRPQIDFQSSDDYSTQMTPDKKFYRLIQNGFYQDEWLFPLTNKEMIYFLWNLNEAHSYLSEESYNSMPLPMAYSGHLGVLYSPKNYQRLYDHEDAQSLRELTKESIQRESRITSMQQMVNLWFAYANYQLDHDNEYVWGYLRGIPWNNSDKAEREQEGYLIGKLMLTSRWTILPTEKFRARPLLYNANGFYSRQAYLYDTLLERQFAFNAFSDRIMNRHDDWLQSAHDKRLFESTPAVRDLAKYNQMNLFEYYVRIYASHRKQTTMFALLAHAKENNCYPETLEELVPEYLEKLPVDPWTGKPFGYIGPDFTGKIDILNRNEDDGDLTFPILWSSGKWELEMVKLPSEVPTYVFSSRKRYRNRVLAEDKFAKRFKSFEEAFFADLRMNPAIMELPILSSDDKP